MKIRHIKLGLLTLLFSLVAFTAKADLGEDRASMNKLFKDGNWKETLVLAEKNFGEVSDQDSHKDLGLAVQCMQKLNDYDQFDDLIILISTHRTDRDIPSEPGSKACVDCLMDLSL